MVLLALLLLILGLTAHRAAAWTPLVAITCNDDWASKASNLVELLRHAPDVIFIQEGKAARYREMRDSDGHRLLPYTTWRVQQDTSSAARAGSVIITRLETVHVHGHGYTFAVKATGLLTRWMAWARALVGGTRVFLFSAHRPPFRARKWWRPFDGNLWGRITRALLAGRLPIGGMDSNEHGGPPGLPRQLRWHAVGDSIDGFLLHASIRVVHIEELPKGSSDHHPVIAQLLIPG